MLKDITGQTGRIHSQMIELCMDYLFGVIDKIQLRKQFVLIGDKELLEKILASGYVYHCKLFVYARSLSKVKASDFGVEREDVALLKRIALSYKINGCRALTLSESNEFEMFVVSQLKTYIGKFISKKLLFLIKSYGLSRQDIESRLLCSAIIALRRKYPYFQSQLHAVNIVKASIHNQGMDIINECTRKKSQRLIKNNDGTFEAVNIDYQCLTKLEAPIPYELRLKDERDSLSALQNKMNKKGALFISLARGEYNEDFSEYLGLDNSELAEKNYNSYLSKIRKYLNVDKAEADNWFSRLRKHL